MFQPGIVHLNLMTESSRTFVLNLKPITISNQRPCRSRDHRSKRHCTNSQHAATHVLCRLRLRDVYCSSAHPSHAPRVPPRAPPKKIQAFVDHAQTAASAVTRHPEKKAIHWLIPSVE